MQTLRRGASRVHCLGLCAVCSRAKVICAEHAQRNEWENGGQHRKRSPHCLFDPSQRQGDWISHDITGSGQHGFARVANARHAVAGGTDPLNPIQTCWESKNFSS